jgi:protein phosphatase
MKLIVAQAGSLGQPRSNSTSACAHRFDAHRRREHLLMVADGGGGRAGEITSRLAIETVSESFFASPAPPGRALSEAFAVANNRIYGATAEQPHTQGMRTSCTAVAMNDQVVHVVHVGDSRAYCQRAQGFVRLTRVHSVWAERVSGAPNASPGETNGRNVLTSALGVDGEFTPDASDTVAVQPGDRFLLCSYGLWGHVTDPEILDILLSYSLDEACRALVDLADERGSPDKASVLIAELQR